MSTDRIEKSILLRAPRAKVWRALSDHREFGTWFRAELEQPFVVGQRTRGRITYEGYEHLTMDVLVERIEPERVLAFRWHPGAIEPHVDYAKEPSTLVEFTLEDAKGGTRLTVVESGFDALPVERRALAFRENDRGWTGQMENIAAHVESKT